MGILKGHSAILLGLLLGFGIYSSPTAFGQARDVDIKAAMLLNFAQFVHWPPASTNSTNFVIGILGKDPFGDTLDRLAQGEKQNGREVVVRRYRYAAEAGQADILFISESEERNWARIKQQLQGRPVLTVSDMSDFAMRGGMIRFVTEGNRVRFRINNEVAKASNLTISSKLLRLGEIVETSRE